MSPAVFGPGGFALSRIQGFLFAVTNGGYPVGADSLGNQILHGGIGPALSEGQIVFGAAPGIAMALYLNPGIGKFF